MYVIHFITFNPSQINKSLSRLGRGWKIKQMQAENMIFMIKNAKNLHKIFRLPPYKMIGRLLYSLWKSSGVMSTNLLTQNQACGVASFWPQVITRIREITHLFDIKNEWKCYRNIFIYSKHSSRCQKSFWKWKQVIHKVKTVPFHRLYFELANFSSAFQLDQQRRLARCIPHRTRESIKYIDILA